MFNNGATINQSNPLANIKQLNLSGDSFLAFYFVPGSTADAVFASNAANALTGAPVAFFSLTAANPDAKDHFRTVDPEVVTRNATTPSDPFFFHFMGEPNGGQDDFDDAEFSMKVG